MLNIVRLDGGVVVEVKQVKPSYTLQDNEFIVSEYTSDYLGKVYNSTDETFSEHVPTQEEINQKAREWRDSELDQSDWIVPVTDHPQHASYLTYRQALRDWPSTSNFPSTKPTL